MSGTYSPDNKRFQSRFYRSSRSPAGRSPARKSPAKRNFSRSPQRDRRNNNNRGDKSNPDPNNCIGIFGLSTRTREEDLTKLFERYGRIDRIQLVTDRNTNESRGFCFINYDNISSATKAIEKANGMDIDGRPVRIDYSLTKRPHDPTPGQYMGRETNRPRDRGEERGRVYEEDRFGRCPPRGPPRSRSPYGNTRAPFRDQRSPFHGGRSPPRMTRPRSPFNGRRSPQRDFRSRSNDRFQRRNQY